MGGKQALIGASTVDLPTLWRRLSDGLAGVVESTVLPAADRVQAGIWLGRLGDPRIPVTQAEWRVAGGSPAPADLAQVANAEVLRRYWRSIPPGSFMIGMTPKEIAQLPKR
jgi:hypothetical protein